MPAASASGPVVVLAGGTGGAKLARGMLDVVGDDLVVIANAQGSELDPSAGPRGVNTKMGLDATKPLDGFPPELRVPEEVMKRIRLEDYLPKFTS